jgi:hypothetical protein
MQEPHLPSDSHRTARLRLALERELLPDETVQWHGWQLARLDPRSFGIYLFAIPWTAFAVMWTTLATVGMANVGEDGPGLIRWAFPLFGVPFVAAGLFMLTRPFVPLYQRGRVLYVVTGERAIKLAFGRTLDVTTVPAERIGLIERRERSDGSGTLKLAVNVGRDRDGDRQTEQFVIGEVADISGAHAALSRIASPGPGRPGASPAAVIPFSS